MDKQAVPDLQAAPDAASNSNQNKRPVKPEEQALMDEFKILNEQFSQQFPTICAFVKKEADRIAKGYKSADEEKTLDVEGGKPIRLTFKVTIPTEKYPNFNYVGRLLGPKGRTLTGLQEMSGCKLAVLGKGSMREKEKEEKCRAEGGKYSHLNEPLHVWMQSYGTPELVFYKLHIACKEIKKYLHADYNDEIFNEQMALLEQEDGFQSAYSSNQSAGRMRGGGRMGAHRGGLLPNCAAAGIAPLHTRSMMSNMGFAAPSRPHGMPGRGAGRGSGRGRGGNFRGGRGGRGGGGHRGRLNAPHANTGGSTNANSGTFYEDVYEPAPPPSTNSATPFLNGSATNNSATSYFEEFPEPRVSAASGDASALPGFQRQTTNSKSVKLPQKNHHASPGPGAATPGAVNTTPTHSQQQRVY